MWDTLKGIDKQINASLCCTVYSLPVKNFFWKFRKKLFKCVPVHPTRGGGWGCACVCVCVWGGGGGGYITSSYRNFLFLYHR